MNVKRHILILIAIFLLWEYPSQSQTVWEYPSQSQTVSEKIDLKYLEYLISLSIDSFRINNNLDVFIQDSVAYQLADCQSKFLVNTSSLSHNQPIKNKKTLSDRIKYYKAPYNSAFELLARIYIPENISTSDSSYYIYEYLAQELKYQWLNSSSDRALLQSKGLKFAAMSTSYNPVEKNIVFCLLLANAPGKYVPHSCSTCFPYPASALPDNLKIADLPKNPQKIILPWKLRVPPSRKAQLAYKRYIQQVPKIEMAVQNDSLFIRMGTIRLAQRFFKRRHDGLCMEIVPFEIYNNKDAYYSIPGRRNGKTVFDGTVTKPTYKKKLFHSLYTSPHISPQEFIVHLSNGHPYSKDQLLEMNLVFIKKNKVVGIIPFVNRCGEPILTYAPALPLKDISQDLSVNNYLPHVKSDTLKLFIPFEWNAYYIDSLYLKLIKYRLSRSNFVPDSVRISSFASVEGNLDINSNLYHKRALPILQLLRQYNFPERKIAATTTENWELFKQQLLGRNDSSLLSLSRDSLQKWVNNHFDTIYVNELLKTQRYTYLWIRFSEKITDSNIDSFAFSEYSHLIQLVIKNIESGKWQSIPTKVYLRLEQIQKYLFQRVHLGKVSYSDVRKLTDPDVIPALLNPVVRRNMMELLYNQIAFESLNTDAPNMNDYLKFLELYLTSGQPKSEAIYNYHVLMIQAHPYPSSEYLSLLKKHIAILERSKFSPELIMHLQLYYHHHFMAMVASSGPFANKSQAASSLRFLYNYYVGRSLSEDLRMKLAKNYWFFEWDKQAMAFLEPLVNKNEPDHQALMLWLKIKYSQIKLSPSNEDIQALLDAGNHLTPNEWCSLFTETCRLNFQLLDNEQLFLMYWLLLPGTNKSSG